MKYIVAVSGGIDSMSLLHMLHTRSPHDLVVAHVDHAVRPDSTQDEDLVRETAADYGLDYVTTRLEKSSDNSEDRLRTERYAWLEKIRQDYEADALVTAHHADDVVETLVLNLVRGTGWRGAASLRSTETIVRPLLEVPKAEIVRYAIENNLRWREDSTNEDVRFTRNYIRHGIVGRLSNQEKKSLRLIIADQHRLREEIEHEAEIYARRLKSNMGYPRYDIIMLPDSVALEILRCIIGQSLESEQLRRLLHFIKTGRQGTLMQVGNGVRALLSAQYVML